MSSDKNPLKIHAMFDEISNYYDSMNNFISFGTHYWVKYLAVKLLKPLPRSNVLDLCCGTGDFTKIFLKYYPRTKIIGLDFSKKMLKCAKIKNPKGVFIQADCTNLPFADEEFDYITMGFGLRNIEDRTIALSEIYRTLKKGGKFLHLDFGYHCFISRIFNSVVLFYAKILGKNISHYLYLIQSKEEFPEPNELEKEFAHNNFSYIKTYNFFLGIISAQIMEKM